MTRRRVDYTIVEEPIKFRNSSYAVFNLFI